ncbi:MAG: hypothetical protein ACJAT9_000536 [Polaribacter sp.]|jgi:hypothetical protein
MKLELCLFQVIMLFFFLIARKPSKSDKYSFFAAGHVYGNPMGKSILKDYTKRLRKKLKL